MNPESLGILELETIHGGFATLDAMMKSGTVDVVAATPIPPGRFLIVIGGAVGQVESSYLRGLECAGPVHDSLYLAEVIPSVLVAVRALAAPFRNPAAEPEEIHALGLFETTTISSGIHAADAGAKGALVELLQIHLARGIAGRSFGLFTGRQDAVEAALVIAEERARRHEAWIGSTLIARPDAAVIQRVLRTGWGFFEGQEVL